MKVLLVIILLALSDYYDEYTNDEVKCSFHHSIAWFVIITKLRPFHRAAYLLSLVLVNFGFSNMRTAFNPNPDDT